MHSHQLHQEQSSQNRDRKVQFNAHRNRHLENKVIEPMKN